MFDGVVDIVFMLLSFLYCLFQKLVVLSFSGVCEFVVVCIEVIWVLCDEIEVEYKGKMIGFWMNLLFVLIICGKVVCSFEDV